MEPYFSLEGCAVKMRRDAGQQRLEWSRSADVADDPPGILPAQFTITPVPETPPRWNKVTVTVTATANGYATGTAAVQVEDPAITVRVFPTSIVDTAGANPGHGIVFLNTPATSDTPITLVSSNAAEATVPDTVTIPKGYSWASFSVAAVPAATAGSVTVTASANGYVSGTASVQG